MLCLSRKERQTIKIDSNITITVNRIKGGVVQIGIQAPPNCKVLRGELEPHDRKAS